MKLSDFKFRVKPLEIVIIVVVITVLSVTTILIKNHVKVEEINNLSLADKTTLNEGDSVILVDKSEVDINQVEETTNNVNYNDTQKNVEENNLEIVIKKGSTAVVHIPSINVLAQVTEGSDQETLKNYVGVVEGSSRPGQVGNYCLAAHNNIDTEIFKNLHKLQNGDLVHIYTQSKLYTYEINDKYNVTPTQTEVLDKSKDKKEITLITCNYNASERVIVKGVLVSEKFTRNT